MPGVTKYSRTNHGRIDTARSFRESGRNSPNEKERMRSERERTRRKLSSHALDRMQTSAWEEKKKRKEKKRKGEKRKEKNPERASWNDHGKESRVSTNFSNSLIHRNRSMSFSRISYDFRSVIIRFQTRVLKRSCMYFLTIFINRDVKRWKKKKRSSISAA